MNVIKTWDRTIVVLFVFAFVFAAVAEAGSIANQSKNTPKEERVRKSLDAGKVVLVAFMDILDPDIVSTKAEINAAANSFSGVVEVVYINSDEKIEDQFREKVKVPTDNTVVFIVVFPGRAVAKLEGKDITRQNLMKSLHSSCGGG